MSGGGLGGGGLGGGLGGGGLGGGLGGGGLGGGLGGGWGGGGHDCVLQLCDSGAPSPYGHAVPSHAGVVMLYVRVWVPPPHDALHELQAPQLPAQLLAPVAGLHPEHVHPPPKTLNMQVPPSHDAAQLPPDPVG